MSTSAGRIYHHGDLGSALLESALELLAEEGADAVSLRAVARRAGVSAMAPYRHYPNKEALLAAVAIQGFEGLRDVLTDADAAARRGDALVAQAVAYVRYALDRPALFKLMFGPKRLGPHPDLTAAGDAAYAVLERRVVAECGDGDGYKIRALGCWALVHGLASLVVDGPLAAAASADADALTRRVAASMLARPGRMTNSR